MIIKITGEMKQEYICYLCSKIEMGTIRLFKMTAYSISEIHERLSDLKPQPANMPMGWSYDSDGYICLKCNKEKTQ